MNSGSPGSGNVTEARIPEQVVEVLKLYKLALELSHYRSLWYRVLALAGHSGARLDQWGFTSGERTAVRIVNSSPAFQSAWRQLCDAEPRHSRALPFLHRVLRSRCIPLPELSDEERQRNRNVAWAIGNQCQRIIDDLEERIKEQEHD